MRWKLFTFNLYQQLSQTNIFKVGIQIEFTDEQSILSTHSFQIWVKKKNKQNCT